MTPPKTPDPGPTGKRTIRAKILAALLGVTGVSLVAFALVAVNGMERLGDHSVRTTLGLSKDVVRISKEALLSQSEAGILRITGDQAHLCDAALKDVARQVRGLAAILKRSADAPGVYPAAPCYSILQRPADPGAAAVYQHRPDIPFAKVSDDLKLSASLGFFVKDVLAGNSNISDFTLGTPSGLFCRFPWSANVAADFDHTSRDWYRRAVAEKKIGWSEPYVGVIARNLRVNCSTPVYRKDGRLAAVVGVNVPLKTIQDRIISMRFNNQGKAYLIDRDRRIIAGEGLETDIENWADPQQAEYFVLDAAEALQRFSAELQDDHPGVLRAHLNGEDSLVAHARLPSLDWSVIFVLPVKALLAPVQATEEAIAAQSQAVGQGVERRTLQTMLYLGLAFLVILAVGLYVALRLAGRITSPIKVLIDGTKRIGAGDWGHRLQIHTGDEIEELSETFNGMAAALGDHVRKLELATVARERIAGELRVATEIQLSHLPHFPLFSSRKEIDIFARMDPAKEVGGDFYDCFFADQDHLCLVIADVADKGVPAALYMMVSKTLIKAEAQREPDPARVLERVNAVLSQDNDNSMFLTAFLAVLDTRTGEVAFANAGHCPPLVKLGAAPFVPLAVKPGFVLGPLPDVAYQTESFTLSAGDALFLYTDGVTEAADGEGLFLGDQVMQDGINRWRAADAKDLVGHMNELVLCHAGCAPQSDDITMLALIYRGHDGGGA